MLKYVYVHDCLYTKVQSQTESLVPKFWKMSILFIVYRLVTGVHVYTIHSQTLERFFMGPYNMLLYYGIIIICGAPIFVVFVGIC